MKDLRKERQQFLSDYRTECCEESIRIEYPFAKPMVFQAVDLPDALSWARELLNACPTLKAVTIWHRAPEAYTMRENWCQGRRWIVTIKK